MASEQRAQIGSGPWHGGRGKELVVNTLESHFLFGDEITQLIATIQSKADELDNRLSLLEEPAMYSPDDDLMYDLRPANIESLRKEASQLRRRFREQEK